MSFKLPHGRPPRLDVRGITRETLAERRREQMAARYAVTKHVSGRITLDAAADMQYLREEWGLTSHADVIEVSVRYLAKATRDGLMHPGVPGTEKIPPR